jgi:succinyl-diaminopimelate desuccinylase
MSPSDYIDRRSPQLLGLLRQMVGIPTVNPPGDHYEKMTALLMRNLQAVGLKTRRYRISGALMRKHLPPEQQGYPRFNVLGKSTVSRTAKTIHFNAHYDVVPVSGRWAHRSPFSGTVSQGWIYGRGTGDMKGSAASLIMALQALRATKTPLNLNLEVSFTADEETDSLLGTGWLVKHAPIRPDFAVVMEGGEGNAVGCGHNGVVWLDVTVHGRASHGSRPQDGINALEKMSALVLALEEYKTKIARHTFKTPAGRVLRATINVGGVFGSGEGAKVNTVPARASFTIDRRVLAVENHAAAERDLRAFLQAAAQRIPQCRITVEKISQNFACYQPPTSPFFAAVAASVQRVRRSRTVFDTSTGFNDMHFFASELKIPTVGYGPGGEDCHGVDERASVRELIASAKIYADLLTTFRGER